MSADPEPRIWTVSEINRAVRTLLEETIPAVWVGGEVSNWTRARSGHRYFSLKDDNAQIDCVMWRHAAERLPTDPEEGTAVRAYGTLTLYEARGRYQLVVQKLEGEGAEGLWRIAFEKLRKKLEAEGLLAPERKREIPRFPETVGVVTSATGAALHDILTVIRRRAPWVRVLVRGTRVQGEGAAEEIAAALRTLTSHGRVDVVIVGRGGGSIEDLWAFNEEPVARAIVDCPVPVISAVGHEVDVTISDLVADLRAPTPSAAGEAAVPDTDALLETLRGIRPRLVRSLRGMVERRWQRADESHARLGRAAERYLAPRREKVSRGRDRLAREIRAVIEGKRHRLGALAGRVEALSPLSTLQRGYAVPRADGRVLRRTSDFQEGDRFVLHVVDGEIESRVTGVEERDRRIASTDGADSGGAG
ncbi:MAG: exodeoxyribonuclease VII large subunit [Longimicrobiales bacterium]|nr:exodeoxyribonuclease VII large subunit [Longimicrobiales bacterium]